MLQVQAGYSGTRVRAGFALFGFSGEGSEDIWAPPELSLGPGVLNPSKEGGRQESVSS